MTATPGESRVIRFSAVAAPALMLAYGVLRWVDGADGQRRDDAAWDVGHVAFFVAIALFAALSVALARTVARLSPARRPVAVAAAVATVSGAACFLWVITGDLNAGFHERAPLPGPLEIAGPILFQLGTLTLLVLLTLTRPRRAPVWSPVAVLAGFALIPVTLDLLPLAAILVSLGLLPLARPATLVPEAGDRAGDRVSDGGRW